MIYAPHASAGRLPTQQGLRFFVDALLEFGDLGREERARIDNQVRAAAEGGGFEGALAETTSLLSDLTRGAGVVLTTKTDARLKHVEFRASGVRPGAGGPGRRGRLDREPRGRDARRYAGVSA